jgi:hypothetical protein
MINSALHTLLRALCSTEWASCAILSDTHLPSPIQLKDLSNTTGTMRTWINVTLHPSYPPTLPGHICDWTITSVIADGKLPDIDSAGHTQWLERLPERMETFSVLNTLAFQHIIKALIVIWMVGLWCQSRRSLGAYRRDQSNMSLMLDIGVASAVYLFATIGALKCCIAVVAVWAAVLDQQLSYAAMVLAFGLAFHNCMVAGICISVAHISWAMFLLMVPWEKTGSGLPTYAAFRASLRRVDKANVQGRAVEAEEKECIICQSFDEPPRRLPCWETHTVCDECLDRLHDSMHSRCPLCRLRLYTIEPAVPAMGGVSDFALACFAASCAIGSIFFALACYKQRLFWVTVAASLLEYITGPIMLEVGQLLERPHTMDNFYPEIWLRGMLVRHAVPSVLCACWSVFWIWELDQATFVEGELVGGISLLEGHTRSFLVVW